MTYDINQFNILTILKNLYLILFIVLKRFNLLK